MPALLALTAAFCWGLGDFIIGTQARRSPILAVALVGQLAGAVLLLAIVIGRDVPAPPTDMLLVGIVTGIMGAAVFCAIIAALAMGNMARVAPVLGLSAVIPVVVGLASGEEPATLQLAGIAVAIIGVMLVSTERVVESHQGYGSTRTALLIAVFAAVGVGLVLVGIDHASEYDPWWTILLFRVTGVILIGAVASFAVLSDPSRLHNLNLSFVPLISFGILDTTANLVWAVASTGGLLSVVAVLGGIFPAVTALLAVLILHEPLDRVQLAGVVTTTVGTAIITAG